MVTATIFVTTVTAVRKTATDCRRLQSLLQALKIEFDAVNVDTKEMRKYVEELTAKAKGAAEPSAIELPLCFVAEKLIGDYDTIEELNEEGKLPVTFRAAGYSGAVVGGENIPVGNATSAAPAASSKPPPEVKKVVKKVIIKRKKVKDGTEGGEAEGEAEADGDEDAPPPPPEDEEDMPPPPAEEDDDIDIDAVEADLPPPPPEEDDEEDLPPPPPMDDEDDLPPPPPDDE